MTEIDDVILDYLFEVGAGNGHRIVQPPKTVWYNLVEVLEVIDRSPATVRRRMATLADEGLLEKVEAQGTYYRISELGIRYVQGDVSRDELTNDA